MALAAEHQKRGPARGGRADYRRVLRDNPSNVDAMRLLALIAPKRTTPDDAENLLQRSDRASRRTSCWRILDLGRLLKEQDRYGEALECFDRAIALEPGQPQAHYLRASTLARASFTHEAIEAYRECLELQPGHIGALLGLGHVLKAVGDYDEAVASYNACIREAPDTGETYWSLANLKTYRFDDARSARWRSVPPPAARTCSRG